MQPHCPQCQSEHTYADGNLWICPACSHEWSEFDSAAEVKPEPEAGLVVKDASGNTLADGDSVTVIKDLKVKGSSSVVKVGTKVRNVRLVESTDGHNLDCKVDGIGAIKLKSEFVRKA